MGVLRKWWWTSIVGFARRIDFCMFRALLSTLRASALWQLSKNHPKIHKNGWKFVKNLLSLKWFLVMLNTFWTQKTCFQYEKAFFVTGLHLKGYHTCYIWPLENVKNAKKNGIFHKKWWKFIKIDIKIFRWDVFEQSLVCVSKMIFDASQRCKHALERLKVS